MPEADSNVITVPFAAWNGDYDLPLRFPAQWEVHRASPADAPEISEAQLAAAFEKTIDSPSVLDLARGRASAAIAVDDATRPTPANRILPHLIELLLRGGIAAKNIRLIMGTASHRPMTPAEVRLKLGDDIASRFPPVMHNFVGPDIRFLGWIHGGPVHLNRHFLDADLRIVLGGVIPHGETGFGGGAKMLIPGLAGRLTIAHFHGALPERLIGDIEYKDKGLDRRGWAEAVAGHVGVHLAVCGVINSRRRLAGLHVGDIVKAHRAAAHQSRALGLTRMPPGWRNNVDVAVTNAYPLDTDPIQMGKSIDIARRSGARSTVILNAASDGIFYHGMGMGSGIYYPRLLRNLPGLLTSPTSLFSYARSMLTGIQHKGLAARLSYFSLNHLAYASFQSQHHPVISDAQAGNASEGAADPLVFSEKFPAWGFKRKYSHGRLFRRWDDLVAALSRRFGSKVRVVVFPCATLQILDESN